MLLFLFPRICVKNQYIKWLICNLQTNILLHLRGIDPVERYNYRLHNFLSENKESFPKLSECNNANIILCNQNVGWEQRSLAGSMSDKVHIRVTRLMKKKMWMQSVIITSLFFFSFLVVISPLVYCLPCLIITWSWYFSYWLRINNG